MPENAVSLVQVTKSFGQHVAVDHLDLAVPRGSIYGFIGPNGSGKTTTLRMIMRILHPDSGQVEVLGEQRLGAASDRVGYLPEERGLYKQMLVRDILLYYAELKGLRRGGAAVDSWLAKLDLSAWARKPVSALSKGMAQKVQFIAAVVAQPELVLLDEPFSGLDPVNTEVLRAAILELRQRGVTVIFSTHDMAVAEKMCDAIFMIYRGCKVLDGTLESIQNRHGADTIHLRLAEGAAPPADLPGVLSSSDFGRCRELRLAPGADPQRVLEALVGQARVLQFELAQPSLHDIFVRIAQPNGDPDHDRE